MASPERTLLKKRSATKAHETMMAIRAPKNEALLISVFPIVVKRFWNVLYT